MNMGKKLCLAILIQNDIQLATVTEPILRQNFSREQLARELIEDNELNQNCDGNDEDSEVMSECSGGSDSDPGQDTLTTQEFENLLPEQCFHALKLSGLCDPKFANTNLQTPVEKPHINLTGGN